MAEFNRLSIGRLEKLELFDKQTVTVAHVESPSLFFCRLVSAEEHFRSLEKLIAQTVDPEQHFQVPDFSLDRTVLVYSSIRKSWCRGRLLSPKQGSIAKVFLVDYGSIELVVANEHYIQEAPKEIAAYNDGFGFCFPCKLDGILPFDDMKCKTTTEWSSYANFVMERETKDRRFMLTLRGRTPENGVVVCDLQALPQSVKSLSTILVNANVAHFTTSTLETEVTIFDLESDTNKENSSEQFMVL